MIVLSDSDIQWMNHNCPDLYYDRPKNLITGELAFCMAYSSEDSYVINPDESHENIIEDVYEIEIDLSKNRLLPSVKETGGRIERSRKKWNLPCIGELHVYTNNTLCLCVKTQEQEKMPDGFNLKQFFRELLIPYFYYQSFFERYGKEPWKGFGHGEIGILEHYDEAYKGDVSKETIELFLKSISLKTLYSIIQKERIQGHHKCICRSGKIFRDCHYRYIFGYTKFKEDIYSFFSREELISICRKIMNR